MSEKKPRIYVGNGKKANTDYDLTNFSVCLEDLTPYGKKAKNGKTYVNCTIGANREPTSFGATHSIWINDYQPKQQESTQSAPVSAGDGLPF